jgi:hypothetical protein
MSAERDPVQLSVTRIGDNTFRIIVQSETKTVAVAIVEQKNIIAALERENRQTMSVKE